MIFEKLVSKPGRRMTDLNNNVKKVAELIKDIRIAMLTTVGEDEAMHSRPMGTQNTEFDGTLWFFTQLVSGKTHDLEKNSKINLAYSSDKDHRYVSISGQGEIVRDREKIKELWTPDLKIWFKDGVNDPNIALIKVTAESAEYWDSPSGAFVRLIGFVKMATGLGTFHGINEKVDLHSKH